MQKTPGKIAGRGVRVPPASWFLREVEIRAGDVAPAWIDEMSISLLARYRPPKPPKKSPGQMVAEASALLKSAEARVAAKPRAAVKELRRKLDSLLGGVLNDGAN